MSSEDCATVLEQFVHDVANLPAEITHLMEEVQAKDRVIQECRTTINSRDNSIQKFIKLNGSLAPNPKEEQYSKTILQNLDRCQTLQDEKIQLSEKACVLLDRQIKKLDFKIRDLVSDGILSNDPPLPSLFDNKIQYGDLPAAFLHEHTSSETPSTSYTPLNPTSGNAITPLAVAQRINQSSSRAPSANPLATQTPSRNSAPSTPTAAALHLQQRHRESSAGAVDSKRRRLNASLGTLPAAPSNLRQSSLGPGTPKAGTPAASRAGSAGPRTGGVTKKAATKKIAPHQQVKKIKSSSNGKLVKRSSSVGVRVKLGNKQSPSAGGGDEEDDESMLSSADGSESENASVSRRHAHGLSLDSDDEMEDEEDEGGEDTKVYCTCRSVSHGDMVACDNDNCPYEWFHWKCVGLTREPLGTWYCVECRQTLGK
ncbi:inhibitor of growth proteins N-terminal histone-binding-domain-containing protein [Talaromyces proteolyticus]|uniref:Chromatin modification-related protein n=1 Tax=Talaromyces proteolyticus TaxID=1131652 RepID=A0AAD4KM34_9EURO|nr:inhibitor of growth proteins N-terminal histone-binding-domain-containing protein [Talaromyces proteolyticus]KAH8695937.1 inhibitor of growth proteins N-terminal histone-binding-domain-containing protein [Talaromyces proteolyticus]